MLWCKLLPDEQQQFSSNLWPKSKSAQSLIRVANESFPQLQLGSSRDQLCGRSLWTQITRLTPGRDTSPDCLNLATQEEAIACLLWATFTKVSWFSDLFRDRSETYELSIDKSQHKHINVLTIRNMISSAPTPTRDTHKVQRYKVKWLIMAREFCVSSIGATYTRQYNTIETWTLVNSYVERLNVISYKTNKTELPFRAP